MQPLRYLAGDRPEMNNGGVNGPLTHGLLLVAPCYARRQDSMKLAQVEQRMGFQTLREQMA